jgi:hypothetical protein
LNMKKHEIEEIDPNEELANPKEVEFTPWDVEALFKDSE